VSLPDLPSAELGALHRRLVARARRTAPSGESEDLAQDAWVKLAAERPREAAPALDVRAFAALRQANADRLRRANCAKRALVTASLDDRHDDRRASAELRLVELEELLLSELGPDALQVARARAAGATERDLAEQPGWSAHRAHAATRRVRRGVPRLKSHLIDD